MYGINLGFTPPAWLPSWPPMPGLPEAGLKRWPLKNRQEWDAEDWRDYALFLEKNGEYLLKELSNTKSELMKQRAKASRQKKVIHQGEAPKSFFDYVIARIKPKAKRGRKKSDNLESVHYARLVISIHDELKADGKSKPYTKILDDDIIGPLSWRDKSDVKGRRKTILSIVSRIKNLQ